jgi:hypothetical protein
MMPGLGVVVGDELPFTTYNEPAIIVRKRKSLTVDRVGDVVSRHSMLPLTEQRNVRQGRRLDALQERLRKGVWMASSFKA